jgi:putative lipoic acid-binding regulatory protein
VTNDKKQPRGLEFPCRFPLKTIGKNNSDFQTIVVDIVRRHVPELKDEEISSRLSEDGKYISITTTFTAESREQLDGLYYELSSHELVMMVL